MNLIDTVASVTGRLVKEKRMPNDYLCILCCKPCGTDVVSDIDRTGEVVSDCCGAEALQSDGHPLSDAQNADIVAAWWDDQDAYAAEMKSFSRRGLEE